MSALELYVTALEKRRLCVWCGTGMQHNVIVRVPPARSRFFPRPPGGDAACAEANSALGREPARGHHCSELVQVHLRVYVMRRLTDLIFISHTWPVAQDNLNTYVKNVGTQAARIALCCCQVAVVLSFHTKA